MILKYARRIVVAVIGGTVVLVGVAMIVLPGPAIVVIPAGLAILGTEFVWARRLLQRLKERAAAVMPTGGRGASGKTPDAPG